MSIPPFLIVADRGSVKTFTVEPTANRGFAPRLVDAFHVSSAPERYDERFSDQAGAFPSGGTAGRGNSIAERMTLDAELQGRAFREVADHMQIELLEKHPAAWGFAAPPEIAGAVLDQVQPGFKKTLRCVVHRDLVKVGADELMEQFAAAQPLH